MTRRSPIPPQHHAFTTIELLVALSIIVILAGLVFIGFKVVSSGGKTRATRNTLELAKTLMNEVEIAKGLPYVKQIYTSPPNAATAYKYAFPPLPNPNPTNQLPTPLDARLNTSTQKGNVSEDLFDLSNNAVRYESIPVIRTQMVMQRIQGVSANRTTLAQLPARSFLSWTSSSTPPAGAAAQVLQIPQTQVTPARYVPNPPLLLDAWENPIIYVPPAGLRGVFFKDDPTTERVVTSVRVRFPYAASTSSDPLRGTFDPGATGFWASAGPDGDFTTGDDNIYSFEGF